jgi:uncharacterized protein (TIGR03000 family)
MLRKAFSFGGILLLAGAAVLAMPGVGRAQRGGGGHFGGGHFGGGHFGGFRSGGFGGGFSRGGFHYGSPHYGYRPFYGSYGYSYPYGDLYPYLGPNATYYPGAATYDWDLDLTPSYPNAYASGAPSGGSYQSFYPPAVQPDTTVHLTVTVPPGAQVWFDDAPTTSTGPVREFVSPRLTEGRQYTYRVRARWQENGKEVTQTQQVGVTAGSHVNVRFPVPPGATGSAVKKG